MKTEIFKLLFRLRKRDVSHGGSAAASCRCSSCCPGRFLSFRSGSGRTFGRRSCLRSCSGGSSALPSCRCLRCTVRCTLFILIREENFIRVIVIHDEKIFRIETGGRACRFRLFLLFRLGCKPGVRLAHRQRHAYNQQNENHNPGTKPAEQGHHATHQQPGDHTAAFKLLPFLEKNVHLIGQIPKVNSVRAGEKHHIYHGGKQHRDQQHAGHPDTRSAGSLKEDHRHPQETDGACVVAVAQHTAHELPNAEDHLALLHKVAHCSEAGEKQKNKRCRNPPHVVFRHSGLLVRLTPHRSRRTGSFLGSFCGFCSFGCIFG